MAGFNPQYFSLINDEPVADAQADLLGVSDPAQQLAKLLVDSRGSTPFTLAVDSGWGTGKSSLMRLVDAELTQAYDVPTVWYNAWTSDGADALEGLIKSVLRNFDKRVLRRAVHRVSERSNLVNLIRALMMLVAGPLGVTRMVDELWTGLSVSPQARNRMQEEIKKSVADWAETAEYSPSRLLVVFIDDLDRCSEETVLAVCEAVRIYLDVPGLAFVIGCDRSALAPSGLLRDLSPAGSAFMEKIFQTTYRIPEPDGSGIESFILRCAQQSGIDMLLNAELVSLIAERSGSNPRRIKRLLNGFVLEVGLNPLWRDFVPRAARSVISILVLQHYYPDFYRMLVGKTADGDDVLTEIQMYRKVRIRLKRRLLRVEDGAASDAEVTRFFAEHEVREPSLENPEAWDEDLKELEAELPREFPDLVAKRGFISLIDDLEQQPEYEELIQRLRQQPSSSSQLTSLIDDLEHQPDYEELIPRHRQQPLSGPPEPVAEPHTEPHATAPAARADRPRARVAAPLEGMRILWIDDNPASVEFDVRAMRRAGAYVEVVEDRADAERHLLAEEHDLLISDITRGENHEAGFTDVEGLRRGNYYSGPVVFFTGRVTPAREAWAEQVGALGVTASPDELQRMVVRAARNRD